MLICEYCGKEWGYGGLPPAHQCNKGRSKMSEEAGMCNQCGFEWVGEEPPMHQCRPLGYLPYEEFRALCAKIDKLEQAVERLNSLFGKTEPIMNDCQRRIIPIPKEKEK